MADPWPAASGLGPGSRGESSGPGLAAHSPSPFPISSFSTPAPSHGADTARLVRAATVARSLLMGGHKIYLFAIPLVRPPPPP